MTEGELDFDPEELAMLRQLFRSEAEDALEAVTAHVLAAGSARPSREALTEVLIIADIIRTIVVDQSLESVGVLGIIVVIRVVLSFSLEVEIDGMWPWNRWRVAPEQTPSDAS